MQEIEKFRFFTEKDDPDFIYLDNPSPMYIRETEKLFGEILGINNIKKYIAIFNINIANSFKFHKNCKEVFLKKIYPNLVKDGEYYYHKDAMTESNQI